MTPLIFPQMDPTEYHSDPCPEPSLSSSIAHLITSKSAQHGWRAHPRMGGRKFEMTKPMESGTVWHHLLLGRGPQYCLVDADDFRTKKAQTERDAAREAGQVPVLLRDHEEKVKVAERIRVNLANLGYDIKADSVHNEVFMQWRETADSGKIVTCRALVDHWDEANLRILDLKFVKDANPRKIDRKFDDFGYHIQGVAYERGVGFNKSEAAGRVRTHFLFCETEGPDYDVVPAIGDGTMVAVGESRWRKAVNIWAHGTTTGEWRGYGPFPIYVSAPNWTLRAEELDDE